MRLALAIILDTFEKPDHTRRKVLVTFKVTKIAHLFHRILRFIGFKSILLTSQDTPDERAGTFLDFNNPKKCQCDGREVLITTYALNIAGHNVQETCCTVISLEPAFSMAEEKQAFFRVHRPGATEEQHIYRMHVPRSYQDLAEMRLFTHHSSIISSLVDIAWNLEKVLAGDFGGEPPSVIRKTKGKGH